MMENTTNASLINLPLVESLLRAPWGLSEIIVKGSANLNIRSQQHISFEAPHQKPNLDNHRKQVTRLRPVYDYLVRNAYQSRGIAAIINPASTLRNSFDLFVTQVDVELKYDVFA
jgi:hypothetical protein